jgi:uncharacterized lipoprotein YbaY
MTTMLTGGRQRQMVPIEVNVDEAVRTEVQVPIFFNLRFGPKLFRTRFVSGTVSP